MQVHILPKHSKCKYTYYQNTHTIVRTLTHYKTHTYTRPHITKQVNTLRTGSFKLFKRPFQGFLTIFNPLNAELNPICYLLALLAHHFLQVSRIRVKSLTLRLLMSYIYIYIYVYMEHLFLMFLDHTQRRSTVGRTPLDE